MAEIKLKPCPFCGKRPIFKLQSNCVIGTSAEAVEFNVYCQKCGFDFPGRYRMEIRFDPNYSAGIERVCDERNEAAEAWNRRTQAEDNYNSSK